MAAPLFNKFTPLFRGKVSQDAQTTADACWNRPLISIDDAANAPDEAKEMAVTGRYLTVCVGKGPIESRCKKF